VNQEHEICDVSVWWFDIQSKRFSVFILDQKEKESSGIDKEVVESMRRLVKRSRCLYSHAAIGKPKYSSKENTGKKNYGIDLYVASLRAFVPTSRASSFTFLELE